MKRKIALIVLGLSLFGSGIALGNSQWGTFQGKQIVHITNSGKDLTASDVPAYIDEGRTMVPLYLLRQAGMQVTWSPNDYVVDVKQTHQYTQTELDQISKSVAKLYVYDASDKAISQGSGFIIDGGAQGKLLITNDHVGSKGPKMRVEVNGEVISLTNAKLFNNVQTDVWAAKIITNAPALPYRKDIALEGTVVTAIGYPHAKYQVSNGTVTLSTNSDLLFDAKIDNGSSGSPLFNDHGEVIGVINAGTNELNAASPTSAIQQELDKQH